MVELRNHLEQKRVEPATIDAAVATLRDQGYLDDDAFARALADDKRTLDQWGSERIARRLRARGVPPEQVDGALSGFDSDCELEAARALLARRFPMLADDPGERRRALGVLVRRGYDLELAGDAVRAHLRGD